ncbi:uncharacterized protein K452DRAFT_239722, partial [Aplosporella prunicola CBS 121167]
AAGEGANEVVVLLLDLKTELPSDDDGITPNLFALINGHTDTAKILLQYGANVNSKNDRLETPLHHAAGYGFILVVKVLLETRR